MCGYTMQHYQAGVEMIRRDLLNGCWAPYIERAITLKPCYDGGVNGGEVSLLSLLCLFSIHRVP